MYLILQVFVTCWICFCLLSSFSPSSSPWSKRQFYSYFHVLYIYIYMILWIYLYLVSSVRENMVSVFLWLGLISQYNYPQLYPFPHKQCNFIFIPEKKLPWTYTLWWLSVHSRNVISTSWPSFEKLLQVLVHQCVVFYRRKLSCCSYLWAVFQNPVMGAGLC